MEGLVGVQVSFHRVFSCTVPFAALRMYQLPFD